MSAWLAVFLIPVALFGQAASAAPAWSGGRPPECGDVARRAGNGWDRAKAPEVKRYCDLIASASSKLAGAKLMAQVALSAAFEADRLCPGYAAPRVLQGRALLAMGDLPGALRELTVARSRDARALEDPPALLAWARVLARAGHREEAGDAYRSLLPRASVLSPVNRSSAQVEAGLVAMHRGEGGLDEAAAALRDAVREGEDETRSTAVLALALALDRGGDSSEARAVLEQRAAHGDPRVVLASARARELLEVAPEETCALSALALEGSDSAGARDEWQKAVVAAAGGPWSAHAKAHLAALQRAGRRSTP
ncbi:MAG: hypothetical protein M3O50_22570 [Myxococcota bacterium]|nr:hypothetical protein [Myxococcota bacterium]